MKGTLKSFLPCMRIEKTFACSVKCHLNFSSSFFFIACTCATDGVHFPGSRPVHLAFSLHFRAVVGHASDLFGVHMGLSFSSNQRVLLFFSRLFSCPLSDSSPFFFHLAFSTWQFLLVLRNSSITRHVTAHRRTSGF